MPRVWLLTAGLCLGSALAHAQVPSLDSASQSGIARLLERFDATASAAGRLDGAARAALFTDDAVVINAFSTYIVGRAAVDSFWRALYTSSTFDSAKVERLDRQIRLLGPGLALVDHLERVTGQRTPTSHRGLPPRITRITLILRHELSGQWRIVYYRAGDQRSRQAQGPPASSP
jgi:uncharacterized protein (TIGR02246 family)